MYNTLAVMKLFKPQWLVPFAMVASIVIVIGFQTLNFEPLNTPADTPIISSKLIYIVKSDDLSTQILDEKSIILVEYPKGKETFVSTLLTVINRDRTKKNIDKASPLVLQETDDGRIGVFDPESQEEIDLMGFGEDNIIIFRDILGR
mgnify:FL=1